MKHSFLAPVIISGMYVFSKNETNLPLN